MNEAIISTKGQIVIPQEFRERYHLTPKTQARWIDMGGVLLLAPKLENPLQASRGFLKTSSFTQQALKKSRRIDKKK